jgi:ribosomal protein S18 acetylase RimI-like enzyme
VTSDCRGQILAASGGLSRIAPGPDREALLPLLRLADDSPSQIASYLHRGDLFVLRGNDGRAHAVALALPALDDAVELKAVAVAPERQRQGVGRRLLGMVIDELRGTGVRRVIAGTASCSLGALAFYQRAGFRLSWIERDYFTAARGYAQELEEHGIPLRDMIWMDRDL